jgi:putative addiction module component (TIGR02574 family)
LSCFRRNALQHSFLLFFRRPPNAPNSDQAADRRASKALHSRRRPTIQVDTENLPSQCRRVDGGLPHVGSGGTLLAMTKAALRDEFRKLSLAERLELVEELWDSIAADCEREPLPLTDAQRADLERRLAEADADPAGGAPWDEVRERIRQRPR